MLEKETSETGRNAKIVLGNESSDEEADEDVDQPAAQQFPVCDMCFGTCRENYLRFATKSVPKNHNFSFRKSEPLISCFECGISYHPSCLRMSPEKAMRCQEYQWRCKDCRICRIEKCGTYVSGPNGDAPGTTCDDCDRAIHYACHESNRKPKFIKCKKCKAEVSFEKS